jgi:ribosomal protein L7/L12
MAGTYTQQQLELKFNAISERLATIEAQLKALSDQAGVPYEQPFSELPPEVVELARAGNKMEAAKRYRELTGADGKEAIEAVGRI